MKGLLYTVFAKISELEEQGRGYRIIPMKIPLMLMYGGKVLWDSESALACNRKHDGGLQSIVEF